MIRPAGNDFSLRIIFSLLLAAIAFVVFTPSLNNDFIGWDDNHYIVDNPYIGPLSFRLVGSIFSSIYFQSYTPLTLLAHALIYKGFGFDPRGYHLANLVMHALNAALVFLIAVRLFSRRGVMRGLRPRSPDVTFSAPALYAGGIGAGLFFAFSPLRLEPVLAAYSLKDVMSAFLALLSILCYLRYVEERGESPGGAYLSLAFLFFVLALLAKGAVAALPGIMILLDVMWEGGGRWHFSRRRILEKIPFFLAAGGIVLVGFIATRDGPEAGGLAGGLAGGVAEKYPWLSGLFNIGFYLVKSVWPGKTVLVYLAVPDARAYAIALVPLVVTALCVAWWRRGIRAPLYAWGAYVILLLPVAHLFPVMAQATAARYAYLSTVPFALLFGSAVSWGMARAGGGWRGVAAVLPAVVIPGVLAVLSFGQIGGWRDAETIWRRTMEENPQSWFMYEQMGHVKKEKGELDSARIYYLYALALDTNSAALRCQLAALWLSRGDTGVAASYLGDRRVEREETVLRYITLGTLRLQQGRKEEALAAFVRSAAIDPASYQSHYDAAVVLQLLGRYPESFSAVESALRVNHAFGDAYFLKGLLLETNLGEPEGAREAYRSAARLGHRAAQRRLLDLGLFW